MYQFFLLLGIYSYSIFLAGLAGLLNKQVIGFLTATFLLLVLNLYISNKKRLSIDNISSWIKQRSIFEKFIILLITLLSLVNLIGAFGPELSFDSLWYHLTIPKLFIQQEKIFHIPGGLIYYSDMPKLIQMIYVPALLFSSEVLAKLINFSFGIGTIVATYLVARKFVSVKYSLLASLIFYSNLVVGWLSITSYIDLARAFFEVGALYYLIEFIQKKENKYLTVSALMLGLTIATKIYSGIDMLSFVLIILLFRKSIKEAIIFAGLCLLVPLPWFIFAYANTGNPFYPFFSSIYRISPEPYLSNLLNFIHSPDPISPTYIIILPLLFLVFKNFAKEARIIALYCLVSFIVWFIAPQSGGGRFLVAYLPAFSVLAAVVVNATDNKLLRSYLISIALFIAAITMVYRFAANYKYIPVIVGAESKKEFLSKNLNFSFGDFYDTDGFLANKIKNKDMVLVEGIHNLYYVDFLFVDRSWLTNKDKFNYILLKDVGLPKEYKDWKLIYENNKTNVKLYNK